MDNTKKVPVLRFPEFSGEWEVKTLDTITDKIGDGLHATPIYDNNGDYYFINGNNLTDKKIVLTENTKKVNEEAFNKHKINLSTQTILMSINGTIGNIAFYNGEKVILGKSACYLNLKQNENRTFIFNIIQTNKITAHFEKELTGSTIKNLSLTSIKSTKIFIPTLPEQQKIADFLTQIDYKIQQLTQKKRLLERYKKGVMQQIFSQEIRFTDDDGGGFPEWEEKELGDICDYKNGGAFESDVVENGEFYLITLNSIDINGKLKSDHKKINYTDNSLKKDDLIMVLSDVAHGDFLGLTDIIPSDNYVLNQRMGALKQKIQINVFYLKTFINFNQKYFKLMGQGSSQQNLSKGDILSFKVGFPCIKEQTKIANFLSALDEKIALVEKQLNGTKQYKKGLLQQMFV